ncbi:hypothetical protein VNO80_27142 [Phaseolus coccineus]|uniref:Uncharacterized protein n=1 Tax=Phaseolus coccineus TaxID=3886 RepID=A0AAN9LFZ5_PHACN
MSSLSSNTYSSLGSLGEWESFPKRAFFSDVEFLSLNGEGSNSSSDTVEVSRGFPGVGVLAKKGKDVRRLFLQSIFSLRKSQGSTSGTRISPSLPNVTLVSCLPEGHPTPKVGASSSSLDFLGQGFLLSNNVTVSICSSEKEMYTSTSIENLNDAFVDLCFRAFIVAKCMGSKLMKKGSLELEGLKSE